VEGDIVVPKSIKFNGCDIKVSLVDHLYRDHDCYGMYMSMNMEILLDASMSEQKQEIIFCHELIEAIKDTYLLEIKEHEIQALAVSICHLIKTKQLDLS